MARPVIDVKIEPDAPKKVLIEDHIEFIHKTSLKSDPTKDFLKMSGIYWCSTVLDLTNSLDKLDKKAIVDFVLSCQKEDGGISSCPEYDSHMLSLLSAVQIMCIFGEESKLDADKIVKYISSMQQEDGSFSGDKWGEIDTRFSFCALTTLKLLNRLNSPGVNIDKASDFLVDCQNWDGGFGTKIGRESHAGQVYCVVGALATIGHLHRISTQKLCWWLAERQLPSGGLNGRPEKKPDVCYTWWVLSSLTIMGKLCWINQKDLIKFILASQDSETGGIADRPGNYPDPYHTLFGLAGMSLLSEYGDEEEDCEVLKWSANNLKSINPVFCMPQYVIDRMKISVQILR